MVDDGLPPATPIRVELRCPHAKTIQVAAEPDGRFSIAYAAGDGCMLTAALSGYSSDSIPPERLPLDPAIPGLALRREGKWQGYALSSTTLAASDESLASFAKGVRALRGGGQENMAEAERRFAQAVEEYPDFAEAWYQLARLRLSRGDIPAARQALRSVLAADPWFISPYQPLLLLEMAEEHWSGGRALCDQWLEMVPDLAEVRFYRAIAALELEDLPAARDDLRAIEAGPEGKSFERVQYLRGRILEREGRLTEAFAEYRRYLADEPEGPAAAEARARLARAKTP